MLHRSCNEEKFVFSMKSNGVMTKEWCALKNIKCLLCKCGITVFIKPSIVNFDCNHIMLFTWACSLNWHPPTLKYIYVQVG